MTVLLPKENYVVVKLIQPILQTDAFFRPVLQEITDLDTIQNELAVNFDATTTNDLSGSWRIMTSRPLVVVGGWFCDLDKEYKISDATGKRPDGLIDIAQHPNGLIYKLILENRASKQTLDIFYFDPARDLVTWRISDRSTMEFLDNRPGPSNLQLFAGCKEKRSGFFRWKSSLHAVRPLRVVKCYTRDDMKVS